MAKITVLSSDIATLKIQEEDYICITDIAKYKDDALANAIGLVAKSGRYGGTYAHKDIAFEFASWVSVEFKLYLIKEFQRLKEEELKQLGWDIRRNLTKLNYKIHTDAIKKIRKFRIFGQGEPMNAQRSKSLR